MPYSSYSLTFTILNQDTSCSENSVDPDHLASQMPSDKDSHCLNLACKYMLTRIQQINYGPCKMEFYWGTYTVFSLSVIPSFCQHFEVLVE